MKLKKGMLSGHRTIVMSVMTILAIWSAFLTGAPVFGQDVPMSLGATIIATLWLAKDIYMRLGVKKAEQAAEKANENAVRAGLGLTRVSQKSIALFLCAGLVVGATGCAGKVARDEILMPALKLAAAGMSEDCYRGVSDALADGDLDQAEADQLLTRAAGLWFAIADGDREGIAERLAVWDELRPFAERGIQDMIDDVEIGPAGAASRIERLNNFEAGLRKAAERL